MVFQLTPPRGGRQPLRSMKMPVSWFQLTPPRGGRLLVQFLYGVYFRVSTHAPTRGATLHGCNAPALQPRFQLTPPRGGRLRHVSNPLFQRKVSTHAPTRGATLVKTLAGCAKVFQLTPPRGGRREYYTAIHLQWQGIPSARTHTMRHAYKCQQVLHNFQDSNNQLIATSANLSGNLQSLDVRVTRTAPS